MPRRSETPRLALPFAFVLSAACVTSTPEAQLERPPESRSDSTAAETSTVAKPEVDPHQWLETIDGERQLEWVRAQNRRTLAKLKSTPAYDELYRDALTILTSNARIPLVGISGKTVDNFWQDNKNVRGVWRRASLRSYRRGKPRWKVVLDVDELAKAEQENWVYQAATCLPPKYDRCMVNLSRGGTDAAVSREYVVSQRKFDPEGFVLPEGKYGRAWLDQDNLLVAADWGGGMTASGYPREVRRWRRGTPFAEAEKIFEAEPTDVAANPIVLRHGQHVVPLIQRGKSFWDQEFYSLDGNQRPERLPLPTRISLSGLFGNALVFRINQPWSYQGASYEPGTLMTFDLASKAARVIAIPTDRQAFAEVRVAKTSIVVSMMEDVKGKAKRYRPSKNGWVGTDLKLPDNGAVRIAGASGSMDEAFILYESLTQPPTMYSVSRTNRLRRVQSLPAHYDATDVRVEQHFATSSDGTKVPYFVMGRRDVLGKGPAPTVQYGYGGFLIPIRPVYYSDPSRPQHGALAGKLWVRRGGVLVLTNIRGGGEYGPRWHSSALRENRQRAFDDFFAVSEDLIRRGVTKPELLGAIGRSNGGLLMGVALTQRPDLYAAIDCGVPLFDMRRYSKLLAGASWMGEYGDPDKPEDWDFIGKYSPYQNLKAGPSYPQALFYTSTKDDRVHPGHARKAVAKLIELGYPTYYYENIEGGHGGTANQNQLAMRTALEYAYFVHKLMTEPAIEIEPASGD